MMMVALQKTSLIDYPGKVSCVLFLPGCNFHCPYCHNPGLLNMGDRQDHLLSEKAAYDFLKSRRDFLDGVVISGGEPTIHSDLITLCKKVKKIGYSLKLDTNGSRPQVIKQLISENLLDYIAMDIKTSPFHYTPTISKRCDPGWLFSSIRAIMESNVEYEFRTTCVKPILNERAIGDILEIIRGAKLYILQRFQHRDILDPDYFEKAGSGYDEDELLHLKSIVAPLVKRCFIR